MDRGAGVSGRERPCYLWVTLQAKEEQYGRPNHHHPRRRAGRRTEPPSSAPRGVRWDGGRSRWRRDSWPGCDRQSRCCAPRRFRARTAGNAASSAARARSGRTLSACDIAHAPGRRTQQRQQRASELDARVARVMTVAASSALEATVAADAWASGRPQTQSRKPPAGELGSACWAAAASLRVTRRTASTSDHGCDRAQRASVHPASSSPAS